jgi:hypothetical protein
VNRTRLGPAVVLLPLALALSLLLGSGTATANRTLPGPDQHPDQSRPTFTKAEAKDVLDQAVSQLRRETKRVRAHKPVGDGADTDITMTLRDLYLARTKLQGEDRRAANEMLSRNRVYTDGEVDPVTVSTPSKQCSTNFCVHYRKAPLKESATATQVQTTLATLEHVRAVETKTLGYRIPVSDAPAVATTDNPDKKFDVFLGDIAQEGLYGYCAPDGADTNTKDGRAPAFCVLDNDYARSQYGTAPVNALRVTAAHEFFHALQFAYDVDEDLWFMEGSATWVEDEVYDSINDNYQFLYDSPIRYPRRSADYSVDMAPYGSFVFFKYAEERLGSRDIVRQFWNYADAPENRYSLQAIRAVMAARNTNWSNLFTQFGSWNTLPVGSYSERAGYPAPVLTLNKRLSGAATSTGWKTVNLTHMSSSAIRIAPASSLSKHKKILIEIDGPNLSHGTNALIQRRYRNGKVTHSMIPLNASGNARLLRDFNRASITSMYLVVSNTSTAMTNCGGVEATYGGPRYSCYGRGSYDSGQSFKVRASLR